MEDNTPPRLYVLTPISKNNYRLTAPTGKEGV